MMSLGSRSPMANGNEGKTQFAVRDLHLPGLDCRSHEP
jgi:hypothetical protein